MIKAECVPEKGELPERIYEGAANLGQQDTSPGSLQSW
jgi:hypothetical protein